jgi:hypothetical protein
MVAMTALTIGTDTCGRVAAKHKPRDVRPANVAKSSHCSRGCQISAWPDHKVHCAQPDMTTNMDPSGTCLGLLLKPSSLRLSTKWKRVECPGTPVNVIYCRLCVTGEFVSWVPRLRSLRINE